ncbi:MAG: DUF4159 domain-containing protein [Planctomycetes bacterium]|nr:DUF4159 domain-containing protein [Planctomycetota bacterium]
MRMPLLTTVVLLVMTVQASAQDTISNQGRRVREKIDKEVQYLFSLQQPDGRFTRPDDSFADRNNTNYAGKDAAAMLGLTLAGMTTQDKRVALGFDALLTAQLQGSYATTLRVSVITKLWDSLDEPRRKRSEFILEQDLTWLVGAQNTLGGWGYTFNDGKNTYGWDFCVTAHATRAMAEAYQTATRFKKDPFLKTQKLCLDRQNRDGGWPYGRGSGYGREDGASYGTMTAATVASLLETRRLLEPEIGCPCGRPTRATKATTQAIEAGLQWIADHFQADKNPESNGNMWRWYWLYCTARVGKATGYKYLGTHDWYREGASAIVNGNREGDPQSEGAISESACGIGFLTSCTEPILLNKMKYHGKWDEHPYDAALWTESVARETCQPLRWQVLDLSRATDEFLESPITLISCEGDLALTDDEKKKLRDITDHGGTIFLEAICGDRKAATAFQRLSKEIWPEWPLEMIGKDDPLWSADLKLVGRLPRLDGIHDGVRTIVLTAPLGLSCEFMPDAARKNPLPLQAVRNLYAYALDHGRPPARFEVRDDGFAAKYGKNKLKAGSRKTVTLSRIRHGGPWASGDNYHPWQRLSANLQKSCGLKIEQAPATQPGQPVAEGVDFLYLTGRSVAGLGEAEQAWLKDYLAKGGFLLAEATCGDPAFDQSLRPLLEQMGLRLEPVTSDSPLLSGQLFDATGHAISKVDYSRTLKSAQPGKNNVAVFDIFDGRRRVGLYSPHDILYSHIGYAAFASQGYAPADARALAENIALLMSIKL